MRTKSLLSLVFALSLSGCGQQTFDVLDSERASDAPGGMNVPARVDIVMVIDNTGSMTGKDAFLAEQIRSQFLSKLDAQLWDYRFTVIPTTPTASVAPLTQIAGSKYSTNHSSSVEPYPNAFSTAASDHTIDPSLFVPSSGFSVAVGTSQGGHEPTFRTVGDVINDSDWQSRFFRSSAKTVLIAVSNGDDTSDSVSSIYPFTMPSTVSADLIQRIRSVKPTARFHAVVNTMSSSCLGGTFTPSRYLNATTQLGGKSYALCNPNGSFDSKSFGTALNSLASEITAMRLEFEQDYVVLESRPTPGTVVLKKRLPNGTEIRLSESTTDGWSWVSSPEQSSTACEIAVPIFDRCKTGYVIRLNGSARAIGNQKIIANYREYGTNASK